MIVVSDTSPLTALITIGEGELLKNLFGEVIIPDAVEAELLKSHSGLPSWVNVRTLQDTTQARLYANSLDQGEAEAIALARELRADYLLIDERKGRRLAQQLGLAVVGVLGVVLIARSEGLIPSARVFLDRLDREAGIYLADDLKNLALKTVGE